MKAHYSCEDYVWVTEDSDELLAAVLHLKNLSEARAFFRDLLSISEMKDITNRWKMARMLHIKMPYKKIEKITNSSSATVAKMQKSLMKGVGGFQTMLNRIDENSKKSTGTFIH